MCIGVLANDKPACNYRASTEGHCKCMSLLRFPWNQNQSHRLFDDIQTR